MQQHFSLIPTLTVAENLVLALAAAAPARPSGGRRAAFASCRASYGLEVDPYARVEDLTVGLQQRAELLKALARRRGS